VAPGSTLRAGPSVIVEAVWWSGRRSKRPDGPPGIDHVVGPGPVRTQVQPSFALPAGQPGGQVQQPVAQQFRGRVAELTFGQGQMAEAGQQVRELGQGAVKLTAPCLYWTPCLPAAERVSGTTPGTNHRARGGLRQQRDMACTGCGWAGRQHEPRDLGRRRGAVPPELRMVPAEQHPARSATDAARPGLVSGARHPGGRRPTL